MIGMNVKTGEKRFLISSKSKDDPSPGSFVGGTGAQSGPIIEGFIWNGTRPYWRSGQWNGIKFLGMPHMSAVYTNGISIVSVSPEGNQYVTLNVFNTSLIKVVFLSPEGYLQIIIWDEGEKEWRVQLQEPESQCDIYGACGPNGICNTDESPICRCLEGFEPSSSEEWSRGNWTNGCVRRVELNCDKNISLLASSRDKTDGFLKLSGLKLPAHFQYLKTDVYNEACEFWCLNNCSCVAFASVTGIGCMFWTGDLMDVRAFSSIGEDLFVRVAHAELDSLIFDFNHVVVATDNFSLTNKLGEGGFGPVYKGKLQNGKEIAVKRLSSRSGQGMEEFKNEIVFISKLQHRNLVRLLGCCVEGEEKLLIYEYMPNKSLDTFLFDPTRKTQLVWAKRFSIIQDMNPKISDFGLARTFQKTQELANTRRVVGTLGYMSPEYVIGGRFSEKSDVFSFGVLLLEIVSGKKNSGFQND
ncbi:S-locus-specific glycoprotein S6 [Theobroma cacao]|uniref:non-specific serine/threonine protein kinase n=1 Tax=Theobroma cacao TaxID=3641 RepID=A0A061GFZ4_THECC|nr:S-locus-specific glycoprotein S6 [Theobroma cacao]